MYAILRGAVCSLYTQSQRDIQCTQRCSGQLWNNATNKNQTALFLCGICNTQTCNRLSTHTYTLHHTRHHCHSHHHLIINSLLLINNYGNCICLSKEAETIWSSIPAPRAICNTQHWHPIRSHSNGKLFSQKPQSHWSTMCSRHVWTWGIIIVDDDDSKW